MFAYYAYTWAKLGAVHVNVNVYAFNYFQENAKISIKYTKL